MAEDAVLRGALECLFRAGRGPGGSVLPPLDSNSLKGERSSEDVLPWSLLASDGAAGKHYVWRPLTRTLHLLRLQHAPPPPLEAEGAGYGEDVDKAQGLSALSRALVLEPPLPSDINICQVVLNSNGSRLALVGPTAVAVVDVQTASRNSPAPSSPLEGASSAHPCQVLRGGPCAAEDERIVQASWHPLSNCHVATLTTDGVFRLYNAVDGDSAAEQEWVLQPGAPHGLSKCAAFWFGGPHHWERVTVTFLFSDGSIFSLCPVLPFHSWIPQSAVDELWRDVAAAPASDSAGGDSSSTDLALHWLRAAFPDYEGPAHPRCAGGSPGMPPGPHGQVQMGSSPGWGRTEGQRGAGGSSAESIGSGSHSTRLLRCRNATLWSASLALQGPAQILKLRGSEEGKGAAGEGQRGGAASDPFCALAGTVVAKDSVLACATRRGLVRISVLGDEMHPLWNAHLKPRVRATEPPPRFSRSEEDSEDVRDPASAGVVSSLARPINSRRGRDGGVGSTVGPMREEGEGDSHPPLLTVGTVDLAAAPVAAGGGGGAVLLPLRLMVAPAQADFVFCAHSSGVDAIQLHWLPFSNNEESRLAQDHGLQAHEEWPLWESALDSSLAEPEGEFPMRPSRGTAPSSPTPVPLHAVVGAVLTGFEVGQGRLVGMDAGGRCVVLPVTRPQWRAKGQRKVKGGVTAEWGEGGGRGTQAISDLVLRGPPPFKLDMSSAIFRAPASSKEGQAMLAKVWRQLHGTHVKYVHLAYVEIKSRRHVVEAAAAQEAQLEQRLREDLDREAASLKSLLARMERAQARTEALRTRAQRLLRKVSANRQPLSAEEKAIKTELDVIELDELPILRAAQEETARKTALLAPRKLRQEAHDGHQQAISMRNGAPGPQLQEHLKSKQGDVEAEVEGLVSQLAALLADLVPAVQVLEDRTSSQL